DEADRLAHPLAFEQRRGATIDLEAILSRLTGEGARHRSKVGVAQLQGDARSGQMCRAKLAAHPLGLLAQGGGERVGIAAVDAERVLGAHRLGGREGLDRRIVAAEGELVQTLTVATESSDERRAWLRLELSNRGETQAAQ